MGLIKLYAVLVISAGLILAPRGVVADATGEVAATLDAFHTAASRADLDTYLGLVTPEMVFLGTDGTERWQGQAWRDFVTENFSSGRGWTYLPGEREVAISEGGGLAWFDELLQHDKLGQCRGSGVLVLGEAGWQLAQYNLSVPVPNSMVMDVAADIRALETR